MHVSDVAELLLGCLGVGFCSGHMFLMRSSLCCQVWHFASCSPGAVMASLKRAAAPLTNIKLLTAIVRLMKPLAASVADFPGTDLPSVWVSCYG